MTILSKGCKPDNFKSHNSLKVSFTDIQDLHSNFAECHTFLESNTSDILAICETNFWWLNWFWQFVCEGSSSFNSKGFSYSYVWSYSLWEGRTSFCMWLISENSDSNLCFWLALFHSVSYFFFFVNHLLCLYVRFLMLFHLT